MARARAIPYPTGKARQSLLMLVMLALCLLATLFSSPQASAQEEGSPTAAVKQVIDTLLGILRSPDFNLERDKATISAEIQRGFDVQAVAQSVLSTNWRNATPEQRTEFKDLMIRTLEGTYLDRVQAYTNESVEFRGEKITGDRATVDTVVVTADTQIPVSYKLRKRSDGWFVYDVEVENVSMVSSYRETYRSVVSRDGIDGLLEQMRTKLGALQTNPELGEPAVPATP